jgi:hypothetical protein
LHRFTLVCTGLHRFALGFFRFPCLVTFRKYKQRFVSILKDDRNLSIWVSNGQAGTGLEGSGRDESDGSCWVGMGRSGRSGTGMVGMGWAVMGQEVMGCMAMGWAAMGLAGSGRVGRFRTGWSGTGRS